MKIFKNWAVHNIFAHPFMQILICLRMPTFARAVHDATLPTAQESGNGD